MNSDSQPDCVDAGTGGEVAPSQLVVDEAAVDPASDGVVLLAPCVEKKEENLQIKIERRRDRRNATNIFGRDFYLPANYKHPVRSYREREKKSKNKSSF